MNTLVIILLGIAMATTLGVLFAGFFAMAKGGEFNAKYGNKLMRARVIAQGIAILLFAVAVLIND